MTKFFKNYYCAIRDLKVFTLTIITVTAVIVVIVFNHFHLSRLINNIKKYHPQNPTIQGLRSHRDSFGN